MAEKAVPLSNSIPKNEPVPWPNAADAEPLEVHNALSDIGGGSTRSPVDDLKVRLLYSVRPYLETIQRSYGDVQHAASRTVSQANRKFRYLANERPMQIVIAVAIASFVTGAALRIWRSNHD